MLVSSASCSSCCPLERHLPRAFPAYGVASQAGRPKQLPVDDPSVPLVGLSPGLSVVCMSLPSAVSACPTEISVSAALCLDPVTGFGEQLADSNLSVERTLAVRKRLGRYERSMVRHCVLGDFMSRNRVAVYLIDSCRTRNTIACSDYYNQAMWIRKALARTRPWPSPFWTHPEVSIRELQQNFRPVMQKVERGEALIVARRPRPIARLVPLRERHPVTPWPDLEARTRSVFGNRLVDLAGTQVVRDARGER